MKKFCMLVIVAACSILTVMKSAHADDLPNRVHEVPREWQVWFETERKGYRCNMNQSPCLDSETCYSINYYSPQMCLTFKSMELLHTWAYGYCETSPKEEEICIQYDENIVECATVFMYTSPDCEGSYYSVDVGVYGACLIVP
jgi:hypothetical protein